MGRSSRLPGVRSTVVSSSPSCRRSVLPTHWPAERTPAPAAGGLPPVADLFELSFRSVGRLGNGVDSTVATNVGEDRWRLPGRTPLRPPPKVRCLQPGAAEHEQGDGEQPAHWVPVPLSLLPPSV